MKKTNIDLIPTERSTTPDYYCTWQTQLYATCDGKPAGQRAIIGEKALFSEEKPYGWAYFYERARGDLNIVMDDSWDVPLDGDPTYYGSLQLSPEKFPEAWEGSENATEALARLVARIKALGWRGLGGWVCAQESPHMIKEGESAEEYWIARMKEAEAAGLAYWKVDWGDKGLDVPYRAMLTARAKEHAPHLTVENACVSGALPYSDVFRTYDVPAILSIPATMIKLRGLLQDAPTPEEGCLGILNCEDEAYTAAAGGFAMGIMRHPYAGAFTNGRADMSAPATHRNIKSKMAEVLRAVCFHRIAPAFGVGGEVTFSETELRDFWNFEDHFDEELEEWWLNCTTLFEHIGRDFVSVSGAPASFSRNIPLPAVTAKGDEIPYTVAARNPNGVISVVTLGRTLGRYYGIPQADVALQTEDATTFGIFGEYATLSLETSFTEKPKAVYAQDLASDTAYDITDEVVWQNGTLTLAGELIHRIGTEGNPEGDTSEPGLVLSLEF